MSKVYIGDTGTQIFLDCGEDITNATALSIKVQKPDNSIVTWPGELSGITSILYTTTDSDFDQEGIWKLQAYVETPDGAWTGAVTVLNIYSAFT